MPHERKKNVADSRCTTFWQLLLLLPLTLMTQPALGQSVTAIEREIEAAHRALICGSRQDCNPQPVARTRSLRGGGARKRSFIFKPDKKEGRDTIAVKASEGSLPSWEREILFAYNSAELLPAARQTLQIIGIALGRKPLPSYRFALVGHTDAKGSESYNQSLSERRAQAARRYLMQTYGITPNRISAYGRGETDLKLPHDPYSAKNRRVQFVNIGLLKPQ